MRLVIVLPRSLLHSVEGVRILTLEFETDPTGVLAEISTRIGADGSVEVDNAFYVEDGQWLESFTIATTVDTDLAAWFEDISGVSVFHTQAVPSGSAGTDVTRVVAFVQEPYPYVLEVALRHHAIPNRLTVHDGTVSMIVTVSEWDSFRELADDIELKFGTFDLVKVNETDRPGEPLDSGRLTDVVVSKLSADQIDALETAYTMGYFTVPRESSAQEVAAALGIQQSTFSERIRAAEETLLGLVFSSR
ncbi:helix-turn-helix domain-containing protein (plasmid) [Halarchaeum sp. CBA1220]|uniref:helix-turn-helix domain-containing protein n=1 Tax=Halarchaeum sp. CBA1220 TaxID=1853682 RepID=UPI000F3A9E26|nr:helix-turn-helix domain-containing protein [Halarchaeum sp. CBA1220]QLC35279.1 helix-turn-helix domain-containing protein [Halarchaeum sp. CBA1220]